MTKLIALIVAVLTLAAFGAVSANAAPVSQIQGTNWKNECKGAGGSMRSCCQSKESSCSAGCQSGNSCGNACTQCKNECSASYNVCVAKAFRMPGGAAAGTTAPITNKQR